MTDKTIAKLLQDAANLREAAREIEKLVRLMRKAKGLLKGKR